MNESSKWRYEIPVRSRFRSPGRAARLATPAHNGSHHVYGKAGSTVRLSIPIHGSKRLKAGLLRHLAKLVEIDDEDLR